MRKVLVVFAVALVVTFMSSCGSQEPEGTDTESSLKIVTTIFPEYDWVRTILGDEGNADITMLMDSGVDMHSFQPTSEDMLTISDCDLFIYVGGESDEWVESAIEEVSNKKMITLDLMDVLGDSVREEETVEGMEEEDGHEDEEGNKEEHEGEEPENDEHVWLSLKNAQTICKAIEKALTEIDPNNAKAYEENLAAYLDQLSALDEKYQQTVDNGEKKTLLFGDRFPFRYMTDDYGLKYYAAFAGCSAETEASFETIKFLADKVDELGLNSVITIEGSDKKIAETIIDNTKTKDQKILTMDSMQSVNAEDLDGGMTYLSIMEKNNQVLSEALQ